MTKNMCCCWVHIKRCVDDDDGNGMCDHYYYQALFFAF